MQWTQVYDPFHNMTLSVFVAVIPLLILAYMLGIKRLPSYKSTGVALVAVLVIAGAAFGMPPKLVMASLASGATVGLTLAYLLIGAITFYITINKTGQFSIIRQSITANTPDPRIQALLICFCFGSFLESIAGGGPPIVITVSLLVGLGFNAYYAASLCLIANSAPVAFGSIGLPIIFSALVTKIPIMRISVMAGREIPFVSLLVPPILVWVISGWKGLRGVWPAVLTVMLVFSSAQFLISNYIGALLTDLLASIASLFALIILQIYWQPQSIWEFPKDSKANHITTTIKAGTNGIRPTKRQIIWAWTPMVILICVVGVWGYPATAKILRAMDYSIDWPGLHNMIIGVPPIMPKAAAISATTPVNWMSNPGTGCLIAALISVIVAKGVAGLKTMGEAILESCHQLRFAIATEVFATSMAWVMNYSGQTSTLGLAFAATGVALPFFSAFLGWFGVFITGSDTKACALFGNLQAVAANQVGMPTVLTVSTNVIGGACGKMISPLELAVATSAGGLSNREGDLFRAVLPYSIGLTVVGGLVALMYAYVFPLLIP